MIFDFDSLIKQSRAYKTPDGAVRITDPSVFFDRPEAKMPLVIMNTYKEFHGLPKEQIIEQSELDQFMKLFKSWVSSVPETHPSFSLTETQAVDFERLGIIKSDKTWDFEKLKEATLYVLDHQDQKPDFEAIKKDIASRISKRP